MQKIIIAGCLGADARVSEPREGRVAINFSVAVNERKNDAEATKWFSCTRWCDADKAKIAEYLKKGTGVIVEGTPEVDVWCNKESGEPQGAIKITVQHLELMSGSRKEKEAEQTAETAAKEANEQPF